MFIRFYTYTQDRYQIKIVKKPLVHSTHESSIE